MGTITLIQSNMLERLANRLSHHIVEARQEKFSFVPDIVLVNNQEMAQWLACRMAEEEGICANINFMLTGTFLWRLSQDLLSFDTKRQSDSGQSSPDAALGKEHLKWLFFKILQEYSKDSVTYEDKIGPLTTSSPQHILDYVKVHGHKGIYGLSDQLAYVFERYLNYRYDVLSKWESGEDAGATLKHTDIVSWQKDLWLQVAKVEGGKFRVSHLIELLETLNEKDHIESRLPKWLPEKLYVFGVSYLPPLHLDLLNALSRLLEVKFYHLVPCKEYWLHVVRPRFQEKLKATYDYETVERLFPVGNPLLASLGDAGRRFLFRFYDLDFGSHEDEELFHSYSPKKLLHRVQHSILHMKQLEKEGPFDSSIEIHSCHSRLRELEVLHDRLVHLFDSDKNIAPHEVAIMAPDISLYAPLIKGVFEAVPKERYIPWSISDLGYLSASKEAEALLALLRTKDSEFTAPEVMDLLAKPVISERFGLNEEAIQVLRQMVHSSGIRRGLETLSPDSDIYQNTWSFGLDRLLATGCLDDEGIISLPDRKKRMLMNFSLEGDAFRKILTLSNFINGLNKLKLEIKQLDEKESGPDRWLDFILETIHRFILPKEEWDGSQVEALVTIIREVIGEMRLCDLKKIPFEVVTEVLQERLSKPLPQRTFFTGKVMFSSLVPLRAIPFKAICLIGMNQNDFPRQDGRPHYDLTLLYPRPDDRNPRDDDRYLFLETIMSAREKLIITYVGRRDTDNQPLTPSGVVSEFIEVIKDGLCNDDQEKLVVEHPLQPFSPKYIDDTEPSLNTFAKEWLPLDEKDELIRPKSISFFAQPEDSWRDMATATINEEISNNGNIEINIEELTDFFSNPIKYYLKKIAKVEIQAGEAILEDHEPFSLPWWIDTHVIKEGLEFGVKNNRFPSTFNEIVHSLIEQTSLDGISPPGRLGEALWQERAKNVYTTAFEKIAKRCPPPKDIFYVDMNLDMNWHSASATIKGQAGYLHGENGIVDCGYSASPSSKIAFWIKHLLASLQGAKGDGVLVAPKKIAAVFASAHTKRAASSWFDDLLLLFLAGKRCFIPFFPNASYIFTKHLQPKVSDKRRKNSAPSSIFSTIEAEKEDALERLCTSLQNASHFSNWRDPWLMYVTRGRWNVPNSWLKMSSFQETSLLVCAPMLFMMKVGR